MQKLNKKGVSATGWTEAIVLSLLFVIIFAVIIIAPMNLMYNKDYQLQTGGSANLTELALGYKSEFSTYQDTSSQEIEGGEVELTDQGLTLKSIGSLVIGIVKLLWGIISGDWIRTIILFMQLPLIIADFIQVLFLISMIFIIVKIFMKVKP